MMDWSLLPFISNIMLTDSPGLFIESLTWLEVEQALTTFDTVLIPLGARCKEHGLHLPLNTDWLTAEYFSRRVAALCRVLVLPTVQYGYYPAFMEYPGSVSINEIAFRDSIADICRSFSRHGIKKFYVLNTGISTIPPLTSAQDLLRQEGARMDFTDIRKCAVAERRLVEQQTHGTHADELETSMMLYIAPQVVHVERARPEAAPHQPGPLTRTAGAAGIHSPTGALGDPTLATREKGELIVEAMVRDIVRSLQVTL